MGLSEERKRQIRAEEEAKLRAEREAEEQYREQIRKELEEQQQGEAEQEFREQVRKELTRTEPPPTPQAAPTPPPAPAAPYTPQAPATPVVSAPRPRKPRRFPKHVVAGLLVLGGLACVGLAFGRGFALPFTGPPGEVTLKMGGSDEWEDTGEVIPTAVDADDIVPTSTGAAAGESTSSIGGTEKPDSTGSTTSTGSTGSGSTGSTGSSRVTGSSSAARAALPGKEVSIEVASGWKVEPSDFNDILEIRWQGSGGASGRKEVVAYLLLVKTDLRRGEDVEEFAERMLEEFLDSTTPDQDIDLENDQEIDNFHGVEALSIDVIAHGDYAYRTRNIYWIKNGSGYVLTCYATGGSFRDRAPAFERMVKSIRLSREVK